MVWAYPKNFYYRIIFTESLIRGGKLDEAFASLTILNESIKLLTEIQQEWFTSYLNFEWALYHFHSGNQDVSLRYANKTISSYRAELDIILGEALLLKGKLLDLKGERKDAIQLYRRCKELNNMTQAIRDTEVFLQKPFTYAK